jgi:hypothetical protein
LSGEEAMMVSVVVHGVGPESIRGPSERRTFRHGVRRIGLGVFFASVAVNAVLGIYALLAPDWGETQTKILLTSLCVTGAVLLALACEPAWERRLLGPVPYAGAILGAVAFAMTIVAIWTETDNETAAKALGSTFTIAAACVVASLVALVRLPPGHEWVVRVTLGLLAVGAVIDALVWWLPGDETVGRALGSTFTIAVACAVAILLALARLAPRHRWVFDVTLGLLAFGALMLSAVYWFGDDPPEIYLRTMGVVLIAFAAFAVTVPVLHWIDRGALAAAEAGTGAVRFCPHCGKKLAGEVRVQLECGRCGREFTITPNVPT